MKTWMKLSMAGVVIALTAAMAVTAFAQQGRGPMGGPGGGRPGGPGGMPPRMMQGPGPQQMMAAGRSGLYLLQDGKLVKFTTALQEAGSVTLATDTTTPSNRQPQQGQGMRPMPPMGLVKVVGEDSDTVLVLLGDKVYRIDGVKMAIVGTVTLPKVTLPTPPAMDEEGAPGAEGPDDQQMMGGPGGGQRGPGGQGMMPPMPSVVELQGNTAYILRGPALVAVDLSTMKITGEKTLQDVVKGHDGR